MLRLAEYNVYQLIMSTLSCSQAKHTQQVHRVSMQLTWQERCVTTPVMFAECHMACRHVHAVLAKVHWPREMLQNLPA